MKVAFFMISVLEQGGGMEKYFIESSVALRQRGLDCDIVTMGNDITVRLNKLLTLFYFKKNNTTLSQVIKESSESIRVKLGSVRYFKRSNINELKLKLNEYDVIYSKNEIIEAFLLKICIGYKNLPPIIFGCHTPIYYPIATSFRAKLHNLLYGSFIYKYLTDGVKIFHVINSSAEARLIALFPQKSIVKIYNPFDFNLFLKRDVFPYGHLFDQTKVNILWVGSLTEAKGVDDLAKIINAINKIGYEGKIVWNICGDGPEKSKILSLKKWGNVNYFGYVESKYMLGIYKQNSLFVSTSHWEGFPYNLLEAQGAGLPVFAYNISGCNDIVDNKRSGILMGDVNQFEDEIINFAKGLYKFHGISDFIVKKFNSESIYKQLMDLFTDVYESQPLT
jgi:glycosyltransferase involved in cell wall biosynthesis